MRPSGASEHGQKRRDRPRLPPKWGSRGSPVRLDAPSHRRGSPRPFARGSRIRAERRPQINSAVPVDVKLGGCWAAQLADIGAPAALRVAPGGAPPPDIGRRLAHPPQSLPDRASHHTIALPTSTVRRLLQPDAVSPVLRQPTPYVAFQIPGGVSFAFSLKDLQGIAQPCDILDPEHRTRWAASHRSRVGVRSSRRRSPVGVRLGYRTAGWRGAGSVAAFGTDHQRFLDPLASSSAAGRTAVPTIEDCRPEQALWGRPIQTT